MSFVSGVLCVICSYVAFYKQYHVFGKDIIRFPSTMEHCPLACFQLDYWIPGMRSPHTQILDTLCGIKYPSWALGYWGGHGPKNWWSVYVCSPWVQWTVDLDEDPLPSLKGLVSGLCSLLLRGMAEQPPPPWAKDTKGSASLQLTPLPAFQVWWGLDLGWLSYGPPKAGPPGKCLWRAP